MNTRNQMLLKKAEVVLTLAKKEKDFVYGLLGKTLEEKNALEKELEALKEEYEHLRTNYATGWHPKWRWPQEQTRLSSSRSGTSTTQQGQKSPNKEGLPLTRKASPGTGDS